MSLEFVSGCPIDDKSALVEVLVWRQATTCYLNQNRRSTSQYGVNIPQWVTILVNIQIYIFYLHCNLYMIIDNCTQIAKFMGPTWGPPGSCRPQMGPMLAAWTLLLGWWCQIRCGVRSLTIHTWVSDDWWTFFQIRNTSMFMAWLNITFLPTYFAFHDYDGNILHWRQRRFLEELANYRLGPARLRQLRVKPGLWSNTMGLLPDT